MIYTFDAVRTITAKIAVEATTAEEAAQMIGVFAILEGLENSDFSGVEEESIKLHSAYETWEGTYAANGRLKSFTSAFTSSEATNIAHYLTGTIDEVEIADRKLAPDEIKRHFEQS